MPTLDEIFKKIEDERLAEMRAEEEAEAQRRAALTQEERDAEDLEEQKKRDKFWDDYERGMKESEEKEEEESDENEDNDEEFE